MASIINYFNGVSTKEHLSTSFQPGEPGQKTIKQLIVWVVSDMAGAGALEIIPLLEWTFLSLNAELVTCTIHCQISG